MRTFSAVFVLLVAFSVLVVPSGGGSSSEVNWKRGVWFPVDTRARNNLEVPVPVVVISPNSGRFDTSTKEVPNFSRDPIGGGLPLISESRGHLNDAFSKVGSVFGNSGRVGGSSNVGSSYTTTTKIPNISRDQIGRGFPLISENPGNLQDAFLKVGKVPLSVGVGSYLNVRGNETATRTTPNFSRDPVGEGLPLISENRGDLNDAFSKVGMVFGNSAGGLAEYSGNQGSLDPIGPPPLAAPPSEVGLTILQPAGWKWTDKSLLVPVTRNPTPTKSYGGWGWPETTLSPKKSGGWGWDAPRNVCADLSTLPITRVAELHPDLRLVEVVDRQLLREVNTRSLVDFPVQLIPSPPVQLTTDSAAKYETTFYDTLSVRIKNGTGFRGSFEIGGGEEEENVIQGAVSILKVESVAMPLGGFADKKGHFVEGLKNAKIARERGETANPAGNSLRKDIFFAADLFERLLDFERAEGEEVEATPTIVSRIEKKSLPDVDHSERTVLDAQFNFGLPASTCEFQNVDVTMEEWKEARRKRKQRRRRPQVSPFGGFLETTEEFVRKRLNLGRTFGLESFEATEERVQKEFFVSQFLFCPKSSGYCEQCPLEPTCDSSQVAQFSAGSISRSGRPRATYKPSRSLCSRQY